jgi:ethanolamine ammonia-lyase small subunit
MNVPDLRDFTCARVSLGRSGDSLPTSELLKLQLAHARAREAVHSKLDTGSIQLELSALNQESVLVRSAATDRFTYLRRPDLGRILHDDSRSLLLEKKRQYDAVFVIADGLSATAVHLHAARMLEATLDSIDRSDWTLAPIVIVEQGRVAIGDEIGDCLGADLSVVFIGERPGLSSADSLGIYMTRSPRPGRTDADRNCISNIRREGLSYELASHKLAFLMHESRLRRLSGVHLKEDAKALR